MTITTTVPHWKPEPVDMKILGEVLESWAEDNVSPDYGFEPSLDASMEFLTLLGQMGYSIVATSSLPTSEPADQLTPQQLAEFDKTGRMPEERPPHHIPCGNCGACAAHEPCARL